MKMKPTLVMILASALATVPFCPTTTLAQSGAESSPPATGTNRFAQRLVAIVNRAPPAETAEDVFQFPGGTPRDFLMAVEKRYNKDFKTAWLNAASNVSDEVRARLPELEKQVNELKVDWLSIAEIPSEMDAVRVPALRVAKAFYLPRVVSQSPGPNGQAVIDVPDQTNYMGSRLKELVDFYNRLGEKKPELGMLVVEGGVSPFTFVVGYLKPSVVMLVPDKASAQGQPQIKVKAFSVRGVPEKDWDKLNEDIAIAQDEGRFYAERQLRRSVQPGQVSLHKASSLLVATGPESYIEMVESIVSAYHTNQVTVSPKKINF